MSEKFVNDQKVGGRQVWKRLGASLIVMGFLGSCSSVPDSLNPVEWYRGTVDLFSDDGQDEAVAVPVEGEDAVPGVSEDFPSLASVPERPAVEQGDNVADGLIADPNTPDYATSIARQTNDDGMMVATVGTADEQSAPPAQPTIAVEAPTVVLPPAEPIMPVATSVATNVTSNVIEPAPATMASPPLVVEPGRLPSGETYEEYRARLMAGLNQTTSSATTALMASQSTQGQLSSLGTVIISSLGVQNGGQFGGGATTMTPQGGISASGFLQIDNTGGQPLLSTGSTKVATIHFSNGSSGLDVNDRRVLQKVAALQQRQGGLIRIIGHASSRTQVMDPVRHKMVNYNVSVARADHIARELVRLGTDKRQILIGAVSDSQPLYYEVMPSGEAGNRRAEIYIDS